MRASIEKELDAPVERWHSMDGGYSPGLASVLETAHGPVFVKAAGRNNEFTQALYRQEVARTAALPRGVPAPALRWSAEFEVADDSWVVIAFDAVAGHAPRHPWDLEELGAVIELSARIAEHLVPAGQLPDAAHEVPSGDWERLAGNPPRSLESFDPWVTRNLERLATLTQPLADAVAGAHLAHGDLRGDNALIARSGSAIHAVAVDWPYALRGAPFCDLVAMAPSVRVEGGPDPEDVLAANPPPQGSEEAVTCYLAALTGFFVRACLEPPPAAIPHLRAFQRAQGEVCIAWLRRRLRD